MASPRPDKQKRDWMYVVDEQFVEMICSVPWRKHPSGYLVGRPEGTLVLMHRYVWSLAGNEGHETLDHINRCPWDNRLCNLRAATRRLQSLNTRQRKGLLPRGVMKVPSGPNFAARGCRNGKIIHLGTYPTAELASVAYQEWRDRQFEEEISASTR